MHKTSRVVLFRISKEWKEHNCPPTDEWMDKMCHVDTLEYYSALKKNGVLRHATVCNNPEAITLRERSQSQKTTYCITPFIHVVQIGKSTETGILVVA